MDKKRLVIVSFAMGVLMAALAELADYMVADRVSENALRIIRPAILFVALFLALGPTLKWIRKHDTKEDA